MRTGTARPAEACYERFVCESDSSITEQRLPPKRVWDLFVKNREQPDLSLRVQVLAVATGYQGWRITFPDLLDTPK